MSNDTAASLTHVVENGPGRDRYNDYGQGSNYEQAAFEQEDEHGIFNQPPHFEQPRSPLSHRNDRVGSPAGWLSSET